MKKPVLLLIFSLVIFPVVYAVNFEMQENLKPAETLIASIEANFLTPIKASDVYFYSDRQQIPLTFDIAQLSDKYYIYALLQNKERNYTILIKNLHYYENGEERIGDFEKNFTVSGNITDFSVQPGFIIAKNNFSLTVESKNQKLTLEAKLLGNTQTVTVPAGQKKTIYFSTDSVQNFTLTEISLSALNTKYSIPAAISGHALKNTTKQNETDEEVLEFSNAKYNFTLNENRQRNFIIFILEA